MKTRCPSCSSNLTKKNGHIHNGKQNYRCLSCSRQFVERPCQKLIDERTKGLIKKTLLERVSLGGICRIYDVSMPWLLNFIDQIIASLPGNLNAEVVQEDDEIEVVVLEADEQWSYVGAKKNPQWLWMVMHSKSSYAGRTSQQTDCRKTLLQTTRNIKKKPSIILTSSLCIPTSFPINNTGLLEKTPVKHLILKDLTAPLDSAALD